MLTSRALLLALAAFCGAIAPVQPAATIAATATGGPRSEGRSSYVLLSPGGHNTVMSGSTDELRRARALRNGEEGLLYVRQNGVAWVIRDAETLRRADALFAPQRAMGARQAELGSRQAALGSRQAALGSQQAALGAQQARLGARMASVDPRAADALGRQQNALGGQQDMLGRQQDELGRQQDALGRQQDVLGREQDRLGREAELGLRALVAAAIRDGAAQRAD